MSAEAAVYAALKAAQAVTDRVGGALSPRIYPTAAPQEAECPFVVYQLVSAAPEYSLGLARDYLRARVQVGAWARGGGNASPALEARALADDVAAALHNAEGTLGGADVDRVVFLDERADYAEETRLHGVVADYQVNWRPAA